MAQRLTPKYKVGDTVYYVNGQFGECKATVQSIHTEIMPGVPFSEPIYTIAWPPIGSAAARESELTTEPRGDTK